MKWEECLKIRWKAVTPERWELHYEGKTVAIVQADKEYFNWSAGGQFDWRPTRNGAMREARWAFWINRWPNYNAAKIFANNVER